MSSDPYWGVIQEHWDAIITMYRTFSGRDQIIELDVTDQKIYSYPSGDYIDHLSDRSKSQAARQFAEAKQCNQFLLFVKDTANRRLHSYLLDLPD